MSLIQRAALRANRLLGEWKQPKRQPDQKPLQPCLRSPLFNDPNLLGSHDRKLSPPADPTSSPNLPNSGFLWSEKPMAVGGGDYLSLGSFDPATKKK